MNCAEKSLGTSLDENVFDLVLGVCIATSKEDYLVLRTEESRYWQASTS